MSNLKNSGSSTSHAAMLVVATSAILSVIATVRPLAQPASDSLRIQATSPCSQIRSSSTGASTTIADAFGGIRFCFWSDDAETVSARRPSEVVRGTGRFVLEMDAEGGPALRMMRSQAGGGLVWYVNATARPIDRAAENWRDQLLEVVDASYDIFLLQGQVARLRGAVAAKYGQRATLQGDRASLQGQVASMRGQIAAIQGRRSGLLGRIASLRVEFESIQGDIAMERASIARLTSARPALTSQAGRTVIDAEIASHEDRIRDLQGHSLDLNTNTRIQAVERDIAALDTDARMSEIQRQIDTFGLPTRLAEVDSRIQALHADEEVAGLEGQIQDLNAAARVSELQAHRSMAVERLREAARAIK
jgi:hypothetical protein